MKGTVIHKEGEPKGNQYKIKGEDGKEYFAHVGDLTNNESIVYGAGDKRDDLNVGDSVEFECSDKPRAFHIQPTKK